MHRIVFLIIFLSFSFFCSGQNSLQNSMESLAADPVLKNQGFSMTVMEVATGKIVAAHQKDRGLIPASSLKVVTTSTALSILGADFKFKTELQYDGSIDSEGTLNGNVFIKGYGDPTLGSDHFGKTIPMEDVMSAFVAAIKSKGIKKINGKIIGDASFYGTQADGRAWLWEDIGNYYGAGAWGLNIRENRYHLTFRQSSKLGAIPKIEKVEPHIPNLLHINEVTSDKKGTGDNAYFFGSIYNYTRFIRGTIPVGSDAFTIKGAIPDPPFFAAYSLMKSLEVAGVTTNQSATSLLELERNGFAESERTVIYTHESPSLKEIVAITNMKSINLYCEAMLRYLGKNGKGAGTAEAGVAVIYEFLEKRGVPLDGFFMEDGSGLSPFNTTSSFHLVSIMRSIGNDKALYDLFRPSLPVAAKSGALRYMFKGTNAVGKIRAKSGGMKRVRSYTGFVESRSGKLLCFSIICNHFKGESSAMRKKMEPVMLKMWDY